MAQIIRYVDTDVAAGDSSGDSWVNAYASLNAWEAAEEVDLDAANNYMTVYTRALSSTPDTTSCLIAGWVTSATDYIEIIGTDFPTNGVFDATKYVIEVDNTAAPDIGLDVAENYVNIYNLQFYVKASGANAITGLEFGTVGGSRLHVMGNCIVKCTSTGTGLISGLSFDASAGQLKCINSTFYGFVNGADASHYAAIPWDLATDSGFYNCTFYGNYYAVIGPTVFPRPYAYNCISVNNFDDFNKADPIENCCTDDGDGNNPVAPLDADWEKEMLDPDNGDFHLVAGGNCIAAGVTDPAVGFWGDSILDIRDIARTVTWDIGAYEYGADPPSSVAPWIHHYQQIGGL